jgi:hypothetical protein
VPSRAAFFAWFFFRVPAEADDLLALGISGNAVQCVFRQAGECVYQFYPKNPELVQYVQENVREKDRL